MQGDCTSDAGLEFIQIKLCTELINGFDKALFFAMIFSEKSNCLQLSTNNLIFCASKGRNFFGIVL